MATPLFDFVGVSVRFGDRLALDGLTMQIPADGVTILATNMKSALDPAFSRAVQRAIDPAAEGRVLVH